MAKFWLMAKISSLDHKFFNPFHLIEFNLLSRHSNHFFNFPNRIQSSSDLMGKVEVLNEWNPTQLKLKELESIIFFILLVTIKSSKKRNSVWYTWHRNIMQKIMTNYHHIALHCLIKSFHKIIVRIYIRICLLFNKITR